MNLVDVRLHGPLGDKYGFAHKFYVNSPRDAINALDANYPGFRSDFLKTEFYGLVVDGDARSEDLMPDVALSPVAKEMDFVPMIEGRSFAPLIVPLLGLINITGTAATILSGLISTALLVGVSMLITPKPKKTTSKETTKDENYMFSGPENITEQGVAVPLIYGRCFIGSVVVSAGLEVAEGVGTTGNNSWSWSRAATVMSMRSMMGDDQVVFVEEPPPEPTPDPVPSGRRRYVPRNA